MPSRTTRSGRPLTDFGLASWPKSWLVKTSKAQKPQKPLKQIPLRPREELLGRAGLVLWIFSPKSENIFECDFSRGEVSDFSQQRPQGKNVSGFDPRKGGFKIIFEVPYNIKPVAALFHSATRLKAPAPHLQWRGGARARENRRQLTPRSR